MISEELQNWATCDKCKKWHGGSKVNGLCRVCSKYEPYPKIESEGIVYGAGYSDLGGRINRKEPSTISFNKGSITTYQFRGGLNAISVSRIKAYIVETETKRYKLSFNDTDRKMIKTFIKGVYDMPGAIMWAMNGSPIRGYAFFIPNCGTLHIFNSCGEKLKTYQNIYVIDDCSGEYDD